MTVDAEHFRQHHPDKFDAIRHLDPGQLFDRQDIGQIVHDPTEILHSIGKGDVAVPGLALAHLFRTPMVITDIRYAIENLFTIQLQHNPKCAVCRWVVGPQVEEHIILMLAAAAHPPFFGFKA